MAAKDIVADMPPPEKLTGDSGGMPPAVDAPPGDVDPGKAAALADFDAAAPGSPERAAALNDFIYMCVQKLKAEGAI